MSADSTANSTILQGALWQQGVLLAHGTASLNHFSGWEQFETNDTTMMEITENSM